MLVHIPIKMTKKLKVLDYKNPANIEEVFHLRLPLNLAAKILIITLHPDVSRVKKLLENP